MHFVSLCKQKPVGISSDNLLPDISVPAFDPYFMKYVRDSFAPVGIMIYRWWNGLPLVGRASIEDITVYLTNNSNDSWSGTVNLKIMQGEDTWDTSSFAAVSSQSLACIVNPNEQEILSYKFTFPHTSGKYKLVAEYKKESGERVQSVRDFEVE